MRRWVAVLAVMVGVGAAAWAADKPFDPASDPAKDLQAAIQQTSAEHKTILLDVGGDAWPWSGVLEEALNEDSELHDLLQQSYVVVHVYTSPAIPNFEFRKDYPRSVSGFPVFYVLSSNGTLITMVDLRRFEKTHKLNDGYDREALRKLLIEFAPKPHKAR